MKLKTFSLFNFINQPSINLAAMTSIKLIQQIHYHPFAGFSFLPFLGNRALMAGCLLIVGLLIEFLDWMSSINKWNQSNYNNNQLNQAIIAVTFELAAQSIKLIPFPDWFIASLRQNIRNEANPGINDWWRLIKLIGLHVLNSDFTHYRFNPH